MLWSRNGINSRISRTAAVAANVDTVTPVQAVEATATTSATFFILSAKLYVPAVTLSINNNIKCLEYRNQPVKNKQEAYENLPKCQEGMIIQQETY